MISDVAVFELHEASYTDGGYWKGKLFYKSQGMYVIPVCPPEGAPTFNLQKDVVSNH